MKLGNGKFENTQFNSRLQPIQIGLGASASTQNLLKLNFDYGTTDNNGNVKSQMITVPTVGANPGFVATQNYTYDSLNRIKQATETIPNQTGWQQTFVYDRYGNRNFNAANTTTIPQGCAVVVCNPTVDPVTNKLVGYVFDNSGDTTTDATGQTLTYDAENKQVQVNDANGVVGQYFYDGDGKRVKKIVPNIGEVTIFVYDAAGKLIQEHSTIVASATEANTNYLTSDYLGSPRITTDQFGQVISRRDFMPFGEEIARQNYGSDSVHQKFTGKERDDEIELDYFAARYYSNYLGRFTSVDPINTTKERLVDPQRLNLFAYVRNNPTVFVDPDGKDVHVAIGTNPVGTATIRVVGASGNQPQTIEVPLYKMVVWDDVNGGEKNVSTYYVTRDAPVMDLNNPTTREIGDAGGVLFAGPAMHNVINSAFEPKGEQDGGNKLVPLAYPAGTDLEAYAVRNIDGSDGLAAEPSNSPERKDKNVATGVMIHVGGTFTRTSGEQRTMGSLGCFGISQGNQATKSFVADVKKRQELNKKEGKGDTTYLRIGKRKNYPRGWTFPVD